MKRAVKWSRAQEMGTNWLEYLRNTAVGVHSTANGARDHLVDARRDDLQFCRRRRPSDPLVEEEHLARSPGDEGRRATCNACVVDDQR